MIRRDYTFLKAIGEEKGHEESIKFRHTMDAIIYCAEDIDGHIKSKCNDLREKCEAARKEYNAKREQFGIEEFKPKPTTNLESWDGDREERERYSKKLQQLMDELEDHERDQLEDLEDEVQDLQSKIDDRIGDDLQLVLESPFIAAYSRFERYLVDLCDAVRESENLLVNRRDLRGQGISSSIDYLRRIAKLDFPENTVEWDVIELLAKIRNSLVHDPERIRGGRDVDPKLLDYRYLYDPFWDDFDVEPTDFIFSFHSIQKIVAIFVRYSEHIDEAWERHDNLKQEFRQGPKHEN